MTTSVFSVCSVAKKDFGCGFAALCALWQKIAADESAEISKKGGNDGLIEIGAPENRIRSD